MWKPMVVSALLDRPPDAAEGGSVILNGCVLESDEVTMQMSYQVCQRVLVSGTNHQVSLRKIA